jgi:DNA-binding MarR family transcriptional regulator
MLPIRQHLLTLTCLKSTAKAVLVEVCELAENGGKGACFASNTTLAQSLGMSKATVVRKIAELEEAGFLGSEVVKAQANRRYLRPTPRLRACYAGGTEAQQLAAATELTIVKNEPETDLTIVKTDTDYSQNGEVTIVKTDTDYSQNGEVTIVKTDTDYSQNASRVLGDDQYDQVTTRDDHPLTPSERAGFQKKIADLEFQVAQLTAENLRLLPPVAQPPRQIAAELQGPQHSDASKALAADMAKVWKLTPMPNGGRKWAQLHRFTHQMELAGRLSEVTKQFAGYRAYLEKRRIEPFNLDKYLGAEADGYPGEWCQTIWSDKAQEAKADGDTVRGVPATPTRTNINLKTAATEQRQAIF